MTKTEVKVEKGVGNRGDHRVYKRSGKKHRTTPPPQDKFEGRCDDLKGHILCCSSGQKESKVEQVLREITEYVGSNYDYGTDLQLTIQKVQAFDVPVPGELEANASDTENLIWNNILTE